VQRYGNSKLPEQPRRIHLWIRLLTLVAIIVGLTALMYETGVIQFFLSKNRLLNFLDSLGPWSIVAFVLLQATQVVAAPVPGEVTGLLGGYLFGSVSGVLLSTIGLTMGSYVAFILARIFGRPLVQRLMPKSTIERFDYLFRHKGAFLIFLLFLIPGFPKDWLCYLLGLGRLTTTEFLVIGGAGRLFGTLLLTLGGSYLRHHQYWKFYILAGIAISVVIIALAYRDRIDRLFRLWYLKGLRRRRQHG
jgi:uncharacterized membrane protein YdjX (TVP38/TMEM64 family)